MPKDWLNLKKVNNQETGISGEDSAVTYLESKGFEILERNYRFSRGEIDIIGLFNNELLVFFEVKYRKNNSYGEPETFVSPKQIKRILEAADEYIIGINWHKDIRFDIISISGGELVHIEDAFY